MINTAQGIAIRGTFEGQQLLMSIMMLNTQLLQTNLNIEFINKSLMKNSMRQKGAATATKGNAKAMAGLALRFVGYNLVLNQVMGAQQKLVEFVKESVTKFREFETRLAEVSTILSEDVDQMSRFKAGIESLATSYGQATSDISKGLYDILSAAFSSSDAMNLLNTSIKASIAGLSEVRTSVDIFTTILNSYGMTVEQASHVSDVLFQSVIRGKFQFKDLEQALGYVVPIASQAGISFDELSAALSTATRHGLHLDMTSRGLALAIQGIVNPSTKAKKAAAEYGVEMNGLALRVLGLKGWFDQLGVAMKKHGKSILGELIPNMRSLRVAMVLAGDEGAKGFAEDLLYLENVTGKTEIALGKMMDTSEFVAKQIGQEMEEVSRDVGEDWDEAMIWWKKGIVEVVANWKSFLPIIGPVFTAIDAGTKRTELQWQATTASLYRYIDGQNNLTYNLKNYLKLKEDEEKLAGTIAAKMGAGEDYTKEYEQMKYLISLEPLLEKVWNTFIGGVQDTQQELGRLEIVLDETERELKDLTRTLYDPIAYGTYNKTIKGTIYLQREQLRATKDQKDMQHDIKMALVDSTYEWVTNNEALRAAVAVVREHKKATKADRVETDMMSVALRRLQIEMLEIQLAGMMRRRGLTRSEEKRMKKIQIEQAKLRLENMKGQHEMTEAMVSDYATAQDTIDEFLRNSEEATYQLKYSYNQQATDLDTLIAKEIEAYKTREEWLKVTNTNIVTEGQKLYDDLVVIFEDETLNMVFEKAFDIGIEEKMASVLARIEAALKGKTVVKPATVSVKTQLNEKLKTNEKFQEMKEKIPTPVLDVLRRRKLPGFFQRGIEYVPETMPAIIHRGEKIIPAGKETGGGTVIEHVTIEVQQVADIDSVEKMSAALGAVNQTGLASRVGKSKYRLR